MEIYLDGLINWIRSPIKPLTYYHINNTQSFTNHPASMDGEIDGVVREIGEFYPQWNTGQERYSDGLWLTSDMIDLEKLKNWVFDRYNEMCKAWGLETPIWSEPIFYGGRTNYILKARSQQFDDGSGGEMEEQIFIISEYTSRAAKEELNESLELLIQIPSAPRPDGWTPEKELEINTKNPYAETEPRRIQIQDDIRGKRHVSFDENRITRVLTKRHGSSFLDDWKEDFNRNK
jgi:hypothetical protein